MIEKLEKTKRIKDIASNVVCQFYGIDIHSKTRQRDYVMGRAMYYKLLRDNTKMSLQGIANAFNKNHATALHSIRQLEGFMEFDYHLRAEYLEINNEFIKSLDSALLTLIDESNSYEWETPKYFNLLDRYNNLKESHNNLKRAHNEIIISTGEINRRYKDLKEKYDRREVYYRDNGFILK